jgi:type III pantothenate kinase
MLLCLDVGNSHIFGGVFAKAKIQLRFRYHTKQATTSDQLGLFLRQVLQENKIAPKKIKAIAISSVVPSIDYSLRAACIKYFQLEPFVLNPSCHSDLKLLIDNPKELGSDFLANSIGATYFHPNQNIIIVSMGTATTFCAINTKKEFLGSTIMPGMKLSMHALQSGTAKLPTVEILPPKTVIGKNTISNIQSIPLAFEIVPIA